ncbi:DUF262 domain-containing HNH endonuclease family protein [Psychrobacter sp. TAE2020]|uniref:DUF262 domain-containing protein n=1 Tax=Psychrobacter sp. TAE2020 TaxID=2846762 RepID=UPI001C1048EC|nr:DUF262 domain-containing protein [Psychrobacter sp. TAE2020]MBU5616466.1 DUF262 domain-containing HNH endonuclease family protein [Psychrobacter sp. TAE2020]
MEAHARNLERIFDSTVSYQIPLFQRPYVWTEEKNWYHLWDDITDVANRYLANENCRSHFLGAVVLERDNNATGSIETRQVIDGQQRFTTLQIMMIAIRDICKKYDNGKLYDRFNDLVCNKRSKVDLDQEAYKIWPTNSDRLAFKTVHQFSSYSKDEIINLDSKVENSQIFKAYQYFIKVLKEWFVEHENDVENCLDALWQVMREHLQIVVIDLHTQDEAQVIFETLNARGTQLLPADLIKNFLFRKLEGSDKEIEQLYNEYWLAFDSNFWREEVSQGRTKRPRIDWFLQNYLSLMLQDDIKVSHLFDSFKAYVRDTEDNYSKFDNSFFQHPKNTTEHLIALKQFSRLYQSITQPQDKRMKLFLYRLEAIDTATVYPLLLLAMRIWEDQQNELNQFLIVLESYLVRRMVCGMTTKNYNRHFTDVIKEIYRTKKQTSSIIKVDDIHTILSKSDSDSSRMPDNIELKESLLKRPLYGRIAQYKIRMILEAIDDANQHSKAETMPIQKDLTIEHILPDKWEKHWSLSNEGKSADEILEQEAFRNTLKNTIGNLTLITGSLNPSISNSAWQIKRTEILKYSKSNLNRYFQPETRDELSEWNEDTIIERSNFLADLFIKVWQAPLEKLKDLDNEKEDNAHLSIDA